MARRHILAIDQGTTNTKVLVVDEGGAVVASASRPVPTAFPRPGWVEQDAREIWRSVEDAIEACLAAAPSPHVDAVGVTNQRESVVVWERRTGQPVGPCITWQCRRTAPFCAHAARARPRSAPSPRHRSADRSAVLRQQGPLAARSGARRTPARGRRRAVRGAQSTAGFSGTSAEAPCTPATRRTPRARSCSTCAPSPGTRTCWKCSGCPRRRCRRSGRRAALQATRAGSGRLEAQVPIASLIGDSHAALFAQSLGHAGVVKATYGTGSSLMRLVPAPVESRTGLATTVAWLMGDQPWYALEGNITVTGGAVEWLARFSRPRRRRSERLLPWQRARTKPTASISFPRSPVWVRRTGTRTREAVLCGLTRGTTAAHVALATLRSIAYQVRDVFEAMRHDAATPIPELLADGGASANDALMQFQADVLGVPVVRNRSADAAAMGAALLAGLAVGVWSSTSRPGAVAASHGLLRASDAGTRARAAVLRLDRGGRTRRHRQALRGGNGRWRASMSCA